MLDTLDHILNEMHSHMFISTLLPALLVGAGIYIYLSRRHQASRTQARVSTSGVSNAPRDMLLVMPDITGFSRFVLASDSRHEEARRITLELLDAVMAAVRERMALAKIEGDAALFFADTNQHTPEQFADVVDDMFKAFDAAKARITCGQCGRDICAHAGLLDLKVFVHRGPVSTFAFRDADDLFGAPVIALFRMSKSGIAAHRYLLVSNDAAPLIDLTRFGPISERTIDLSDVGAMPVFLAGDDAFPTRQSSRQPTSTENKMTRRRLIATVLATALGLSTWHFAAAHSGATGIVKERMEMMKGMGTAMKQIAGMLRGKSDYDAERVRTLAEDMKKHAVHMPMMFPEGTGKKPSEAKATIWTDTDGFKTASMELAQYAGALAESADDKSSAMKAFRNVGQSCKSCHTDYREKKN